MKKNFNALIVSSYKSFFVTKKPFLEGYDFDEIICASSIAQAQKILMTKSISAIIINTPLSDGLGLDFATDCASKKFYSVLLFAKNELYEQIAEKTAPLGIFTLSENTDCITLSETFCVVASTAKKLFSLDTEEEKSASKAEELRISSRAKMILISSFGMNEEQAHKYIEQRAMEMRKSKKDIALSIISSYGK